VSYYHRKDPVIKHVDLLLSCGCTVTAKYDPDKDQPYELGDQFFCHAKHKDIFIVQSITPWDEIVIE